MEDCKKMEDDFKKIDDFINITLKEATSSKTSLNIYGDTDKNAEIKRENLRFYLKKMRTLNPSRLFVGEAPGINGCFWTGIPFTDINTLVNNSFFQERKEKMYSSIDSCNEYEGEVKELVSLIFNKNKINKKGKLEHSIINTLRREREKKKIEFKERIEERIELVYSIIDPCEKCDGRIKELVHLILNEKPIENKINKKKELEYSIINTLKKEREKKKTEFKEEIEKKIKLVYLIIDFHVKNNVMINEFPEKTSSTVWKCLDKLAEKDLKYPLLWNIYPFHPGKNAGNKTDNRTPTPEECKIGVNLLFDLLKCFNIKEIFPVGDVAKDVLEEKIPLTDHSLCHPAARRGGITKFRKKFNEIYQIKDISPTPKNKKNQNNNNKKKKGQNSENSEE